MDSAEEKHGGVDDGETGLKITRVHHADVVTAEDAETASTIDWKQDRLDADCLLQSLHRAYVEDQKHRKWLLTRWPEWPTKQLKSQLPNAERFTSECFVRDSEEDTSQSMQSVKIHVRENFLLLGVEADKDGRFDMPEATEKLSDEGLVEAIPVLLRKLRLDVLRTLFDLVVGQKSIAKSRPWLIGKISKKLEALTGHSEHAAILSTLQEVFAVFRNPQSFQKENPHTQILLETSSPHMAARSALMQLLQLPQRCLEVMREVLFETPMESRHTRTSIIKALQRRGKLLLKKTKTEKELPESLRRALVVMSVSARHAFGHDGNLINFLGPIPEETQQIQSELLSALSNLEKLNHDNARLVWVELIGALKVHNKRHCRNYIEVIRRNLYEFLLWSEITCVPEEVKKVLSTLQSLVLKQPDGLQNVYLDFSSKATPANDQRVELEVEATLRISAHLQQVLYDWNEDLAGRSSYEDGQRTYGRNTLAPDGSQSHGHCCEGIQSQNITRIADEIAEVAYSLTGNAMERVSRSSGVSLQKPVKRYLRGKLKRKLPSIPGEGLDQLAMILKTAENMPGINSRVMGNVRRRLGVE